MSFERLSWTWVESPLAFENKFKYLAAKLNETGSSTSNKTASSAPVSFWVKTAFPDPISPVIENLICYLLVSILMVSDKLPNYLQILLNSVDGMVTIDLNSVSGIPRFYESRFNNERLNSEILSPPKKWIKYYFWIQTWILKKMVLPQLEVSCYHRFRQFLRSLQRFQ